jgi:WD40 repeat protein
MHLLVISVAYAHRYQRAFSGSISGTFYVWNLKTFTLIASLPTPGATAISRPLVGQLAISPSSLLSGNADGTIGVWDVSSHTEIITLGQLHVELHAAVESMALDNYRVAVTVGNRITISEVGFDVPESFDLSTSANRISHVILDGQCCIAAYVTDNGLVVETWRFPKWIVDTPRESKEIS